MINVLPEIDLEIERMAHSEVLTYFLTMQNNIFDISVFNGTTSDGSNATIDIPFNPSGEGEIIFFVPLQQYKAYKEEMHRELNNLVKTEYVWFDLPYAIQDEKSGKILKQEKVRYTCVFKKILDLGIDIQNKKHKMYVFKIIYEFTNVK